ncbi:MAG: VCBS repeat-containing protein [Candidatus Electryonea clarkiae]|nr:VCBS repeat-containing protein [Candidatus Electryonea clarkiae]
MKTAVTFAILSLVILFLSPVQVFARIVFAEHIIDSLRYPSFVHFADIDFDGDIDLAVTAAGNDNMVWYENGHATNLGFERHYVFENVDEPYSVFSIDIDSDEDIDFITGSHIAGIVLWENDGEQNFTNTNLDREYRVVQSVYAADINQDNDIDIIGASRSQHGIKYWENIDNGEFIGYVITEDFNTAMTVYVEDMDCDDDLDILGGAYGDSTISWWENDGEDEPEFTEHIVENSFDGPICVYAADIDSDNDMDVLAAAHSADNIRWWENNGNEEYTEHVITDEFNYGRFVRAADFDQDGDLDIVGSGDGTVMWWENNGEEEWTEYTLIENYRSATCTIPVDIDLDDDMDIVTVSAIALGHVTWWENLGVPPQEFEFASPEDGEIIHDDTVTVNWTASSDPDGFQYIVEWSIFEEFPQDSTSIETTTDTFFVLTEVQDFLLTTGDLDELPDDATIYWRVNAVNESGALTWANNDEEGWSFNIYVYEPPDPFDLISPPDGFELINRSDFPLIFVWHTTTDPDPGDSLIYVFELSLAHFS